MEEIDTNDAKTKRRIIDHMNKDHKSTLRRFMEYYNRLPRSWAQDAVLEDLTLEHMILHSGSHRNIIYFEPPLSSFSETRSRLISMDQVALDKLGRSSIVIDRYVPPRGFHLLVFMACVLTFAAFWRRANFEPGSLLYENLLWRVPGFAAFCGKIQPWLFWPMVLLHATEAAWLDLKRLRRHEVERGTRLWWMWVGSMFIEGLGAKVRFDRLVEARTREKEERKAKAKAKEAGRS